MLHEINQPKLFNTDVTVNAFDGSVQYTIPLDITSARDLLPEFTISYHSNNKNSVFGLGFDLTILKITRASVRGRPTYDDALDVFYLAGIGELVRGETTEIVNEKPWKVINYYPITVEKFIIIQFWCNDDNSAQNYWLVKEGKGINHRLGKQFKIANPDNPEQIYSWLLEESVDAKGNKVVYQYEKQGTDANYYLSTIQYGNYEHASSEIFACELKLDYGQYILENIKVDKIDSTKEADLRPDSFVTYQAGFAITTQRRCYNIFLLHRLPDLFNNKPTLIRQWQFNYQTDHLTKISLLSAVHCHGYRRLQSGQYLTKAMPPLKFSYSQLNPFEAVMQDEMKFPEGFINNDASHYRFVDLYKEGLPGIFYQSDNLNVFWRNEGNGKFAKPEVFDNIPVMSKSHTSTLRFIDLLEDDNLALIVGEDNYGGFYSLSNDRVWLNFQSFEQYPSDFTSPYAEHIDLNNTGYSDLVILDAFNPVYYPSLGKKGFASPQPCKYPTDFPVNNLSYIDWIGFANILDDGILHRVRINGHRIDYWPNLGQGKFGEKVTILAPNKSAFIEDFDPSRLFLMNIKGVNGVDIVYINFDHIAIYINQNGQFNTNPIKVSLPKSINYTHFDRIELVDLDRKSVV